MLSFIWVITFLSFQCAYSQSSSTRDSQMLSEMRESNQALREIRDLLKQQALGPYTTQ